MKVAMLLGGFCLGGTLALALVGTVIEREDQARALLAGALCGAVIGAALVVIL